jgi:hypothetical protein
MTNATNEQRAWIQRVLGLSFAAMGTDEDETEDFEIEDHEIEDISTEPEKPQLLSIPKQPLLPIWVAAKVDLDGDIDKLQRALREDGDEGLLQIAEYGLHKVTEGNSVKLMVALRDADSAKNEKAIAKVYDAIQAFRAFLTNSESVDIIEDNPVDVYVPVRAKLGAALDQLARTIEA